MPKNTAVSIVMALIALPVALPAGAQQTKPAKPVKSAPPSASLAHGATGSLMVDGKKIPLSYAYAVQVDDAEGAGLLMAGPRTFFVLVLTDHALPPTSVSDRSAPQSEIKSIAQAFDPAFKSPSTKIYGILLRVDAATQKPFHAEFFYPGRDSLSMSIVGMDIPDKITGLKVVNHALSGTATLASATNTGAEKGPKKYQYRVSFQAPLLSEPPVTQVWDGKAALESPPSQAVRAYLTAAQKGDVETMRGLTMPTHLAYLNKPEVIDGMKQGDPAKMAEQVKRVVVRGGLSRERETAAVILVSETPSYSQVTLSLGRDNGVWKLYWP